MDKIIFLAISLMSVTSFSADQMCYGEKSEDTLAKVHTVQRALSCRNDTSLTACNEYLGLGMVGLAAVEGAKAANKVRNSDFRICTTKTASGFHFQIFPEAVAGMDCMAKETFQKRFIKEATEQGIKDLERMEAGLTQQIRDLGGVEALKNQIRAQEQKMGQPAEVKTLQHYGEDVSNALDDFHNVRATIPEAVALDQAEIERADIRNQIKDHYNGKRVQSKVSVDALEAREKELNQKVAGLEKDVARNPKYIEASGKYYQADEKYQKALAGKLAPEHVGRNVEQEAKVLTALKEKEQAMGDLVAARAIVKANLDKMKRLGSVPVSNANIEAKLKTLVEVGSTSTKQLSSFKGLAFLEGAEGNAFFVGRRFGRVAGFAEKFIPFLKAGGKAAGAIGSVLAFAGAASAHDLDYATADLIAAATFSTASSNCGGEIENPYFDKGYNCKANYKLTPKSENLYALTDDEAIKTFQQYPGMCDFLDSSVQQFYPKVKTSCGTDLNMKTDKGTPLAYFSSNIRDAQSPQHVKLFADKSIYDMVVSPSGEILSVDYTSTTKGSDFALAKLGKSGAVTSTRRLNLEKDTETVAKARVLLQYRMAAMVEASSCCSKDGLSPSDADCARVGVAKNSGNSYNGNSVSPNTIQ